MKKLCVLDVDDTLIEWHYSLFNVTHSVRTGVYEVLDYLTDNNIDIALFSTAPLPYVKRIREKYFKHYQFTSLKGAESVTYLGDERVKNISVYEPLGYDIKNIVLVDDKERNAKLYPENFIKVRPPSYYNVREIFDEGLIRTIPKLKSYFK